MRMGVLGRLLAWVLTIALLSGGMSFANVAFADDGDDDDADYDDMTPRARLDYAEATVAEVKSALNHVLGLIKKAQAAKDSLLLTCLNKTLGDLKGLQVVAQNAEVDMRAAMAKENEDEAAHQFQKLAMAQKDAKRIVAVADACVGTVGVSYSGQGRWSSNVPDADDVDDDFDSDPDGYARPNEKSPFR